MPAIAFASQSYLSRSLPLSAQRCVNCYPEKEPEDAKSPVALFGSPGLVQFASAGTGPVRGWTLMNNVVYLVSGQRFYSLTSAGVVTDLGGSIPGTGKVSVANNGTQVCVVNGTTGYIWSSTGGFQAITDPNWHSANTVTFYDNFFVFDWANTNKFFSSNSLDGTSYNGLNFASAEVSSDYVLSLINQQENLYIFGQSTIETWYDAGNVNFPFLRVNGGTIERGCSAALSPIKEDNSIFFIGDDTVFYRLSGTSLQRVSTHAVESAWESYLSISDAYTFSFTWDGHKQICVVFPSANATWIYDIASDRWHERESWDANNNSFGRWRGNVAIAAWGYVLIGDAYSGAIGYLSDTTYTEFGNTMRMLATSPPLADDRARLYISSLEMDVESGVGLNTGQGSDPQFMLECSIDGGRTWKNPQRWSSIGKIGAYLSRCRWTRLGQGRQWVFRITCSDPVKRVVIRSHASVSKGL